MVAKGDKKVKVFLEVQVCFGLLREIWVSRWIWILDSMRGGLVCVFGGIWEKYELVEIWESWKFGRSFVFFDKGFEVSDGYSVEN